MTMKKEYLQLERREQWAIVRLDHPPVNSPHLALMDQLNEKLIQLEGEEKIEVIITGTGKSFAAERDIEELQRVDAFSEGLQLSHRIHSGSNRVDLDLANLRLSEEPHGHEGNDRQWLASYGRYRQER